METFVLVKKFLSTAFNGNYSLTPVIEKLLLSSSETECALGRALQKTVTHSFTQDELYSIEAIEQYRNSLLNDTTKIEMLDYGAYRRNGEAVRKELAVRTICRTSASPKKMCLLLFSLIREMKPAVCMEMGTNLGVSGSYLAAAAKLNGSGFVYSLEGSPSLAEIASTHFYQIGLSNIKVFKGQFAETIPNIVASSPPISFVYIDGHHEEFATLRYYEMLKPHLSENALLVFDDICWSKGMERAWNTIRTSSPVILSVDLFTMGLCFTDPVSTEKKTYNALWVR
ncbi:MAG TPA: class I SAM-dependent methyltransferase [Bacteroidota bacterium]|nr:class I SAM-dependent methyltransferase [Bacteroidota bacterium]